MGNLREAMSLSDEQSAQASLFLEGLSHNMSVLDVAKHVEVIQAVLVANPWGLKPYLRARHLELLRNLAVAKGTLTQQCLHLLVQHLKPLPEWVALQPKPSQAEGGAQESSSRDAPWEPQPHAVAVQDEVVLCLAQVWTLPH